ncbi:hypothetical protein OKW40_004386 [Paraburkholderia sp. RAU6.4a]
MVEKRGLAVAQARLAASNLSRSHVPMFDFSLLRYFEGIVDLNPEISNSAFQFAVTKQELNGSKILRPLVDQGGLRPAHRVRAVSGRIKTDCSDPLMNHPGVLSR